MSLINYNEMASFTDKRIIKSRRCIFEAFVLLAKEKPLFSVSVTELCRVAVINRKTFYSQYESVLAAFDDYEKHIIMAYLNRLREKGILTRSAFKPRDFIMETHAIIEENRDSFDILYQYFSASTFMRKFGAILGQFVLRDPAVRTGSLEQQYLASALVFSITGLLNCYLDWINLGRQISIEEVAQIAEYLMTHSLRDCLN